jgi:hypothetical protein
MQALKQAAQESTHAVHFLKSLWSQILELSGSPQYNKEEEEEEEEEETLYEGHCVSNLMVAGSNPTQQYFFFFTKEARKINKII